MTGLFIPDGSGCTLTGLFLAVGAVSPPVTVAAGLAGGDVLCRIMSA